MSVIKQEEAQERSGDNNKFIAEMLVDEDDAVIAPQSNRFNLKSAWLKTTNQTAFEAAAAATQKGKSLEDAEKLEYLDDDDLIAQFKQAKGRKIIISESTYDDPTLWRVHDVYRGHGAVTRTIDTLVNFTVGRKRTTVVLDTNDYYDSDTDEHMALEEIQNNDIYRKYVRGLSKIQKNLNMNFHMSALLTNALIFGKGAIMIEYDKDPADPTALPKALKSLSPLRIGRVFYYEDTWDLAGIEYLDFKQDSIIIEANRLIYYANKDYHQSPRTIWHGYSLVEPILDIAETSILNNQTNIKEINRRLWAAFVIIKYMGKRKSDIDKFKKFYKPGMPIISNRDFEAQVVEVAHDLDKLMQQQEMTDQKIVRDLNIPNILGGFGNAQAQATAGAELHSWLSSALETRRTTLRNVFEAQWVNPILKRLIIVNGDTMETLKLPVQDLPDPQPIVNTPEEPAPLQQTGGVSDTNIQGQAPPTNAQPPPITPVPLPPHMMPQAPPKLNHLPQDIADRKTPAEDIIISNIKKDPSEITIEDLPFKIKLQFTSFSVSTILDLASTVIGLKKAGLLDMELGLTELDRKEYIPHMSQIEKQNQQIFMQMQQGQNPFDPSKGLQDQPAFKGAGGRNKKGQGSKDQSSGGPDASNRAESIIANKTNLSKNTGSKTAGANRTMRSL